MDGARAHGLPHGATLILFLSLDDRPEGGIFSASQEMPPLDDPHLVEVRVVPNFPADVWAFALAGGLPVDEDHSNDSTWAPWWPDGVPIWTR